MHTTSHDLAHQTVSVTLKAPVLVGNDAGITTIPRYRIDDWWDKLTGMSWQDSNGNPAAMSYAMRTATAHATESGKPIPWDDDVVYGTNLDSNMGHLVHVSELDTTDGSPA